MLAMQWAVRLRLAVMLVVVSTSTGCATDSLFLSSDIPAIPAHRVPRELLGRSREEMLPTSISRLRRSPPEVYQLGGGDVLGIYIETILGSTEQAPPVHFPEQGDQAPAIGFPIPIREDGTVQLPLIDAIQVSGLTLTQATEAIREAYTVRRRILPEGRDRIIVTLIRRREHRVLVIREEAGAREGVTKRGTGDNVDLPHYENDVMHALNETGGLPGLDAKNEILIIRGMQGDGAERDRMIAQLMSCRQPCSCPPPLPGDPNTTVIPLRYYPESPPTFTEEDIILETGDIVYIPTRDEDRYYTGGLLGGGSQLLPRDRDLTVLAAISEAGGPLGSGGSGVSQIGGRGNSGGGRGYAGIAPSKLIVIRKLCDGSVLPIQIDLNRALVDSSQNILVQPEDTLILKYTCAEELTNAALSLFQVNFLLNSLN